MSVSIVIPVYNVEKYLRKCLDSVCVQDECVKEIILVNDGSTDGSLQICEEYADKNNRIKVINQENKGVEKAVYSSILAATGEYIGFVDGDDYVDPSMFKKLYDKITQTQADIVVCGYSRVDENNNILSQYRLNWLQQDVYDKIDGAYSIDFLPRVNGKQSMSYSRCNKLFKREMLINNYYCKPHGLTVGEDTVMIFSMIFSSNRVAILDECLYYYVQRIGSAVHSFDEKYIKNWETVIDLLPKAAEEYGYRIQDFNEVALALMGHLCLNKVRFSNMKHNKKAEAYRQIGHSKVFRQLLRSSKIKMTFKRKLVFCLLKLKLYYILSLIY